MGVRILVPNEERAKAYWYKFKDGKVYSVHVAEYHDKDDVIFASDKDTWPSYNLEGSFTDYKLLRNATEEEAEAWFGSVIVARIEV